MTTLHLIELTCPVCENLFRSQTVVATNAFGGKRTDFHERAAGMQPLPYFVHMCANCGYSGVERDFSDDLSVDADIQACVWRELAPALRHELPSASLKYEHAAKVAGWMNSDPRYLADLYLRAAWCCVDERDSEAERFFRRKAAWNFAEALEMYDSVQREDRAVLTYLVGELWRRIGDAALAQQWFDRVLNEIIEPGSQAWVVEAAAQQRHSPREWFP